MAAATPSIADVKLDKPASFCRWSAACTNPGPWVAWLDGFWLECIDPANADRPIYCVAHAREFQVGYVPKTVTLAVKGGSYRNPRAAPALLFCRHMIDSAIADASSKINPEDGNPTEDALLARAWIEYVPDKRDPQDFAASFEWCCAWLSLDVETERAGDIEKIDAALIKASHAAKRREFAKRQDQAVAKAMGKHGEDTAREVKREQAAAYSASQIDAQGDLFLTGVVNTEERDVAHAG